MHIFLAGYSSENKNVAIWDTLLPQKKAMVIGKYLKINCSIRIILKVMMINNI